MINIDIFTLGNEFKDDTGNIYKVISHLGEGKKIYIELELVVPVNEPLKELLEDN